MRIAQSLCLATLLLGAGCGQRPDAINVSVYDYRDTRDLVRFVNGVARTLEQEGLGALEDATRSMGRSGESYIYVYDMDHTCLFHAGMPDLAGKNLEDVADIEGKPIARLIREALDNPDNPHGWVHYTWWEPGKFYPVPK